MKRVAFCLITNDKDEVLTGKRRDNGKYTFPGGHLEDHEDPKKGILRELKEETNLDGFSPKLVDVRKTPRALVYTFIVKLKNSKTDSSKDPDKEVHKWEYRSPVDLSPDQWHVEPRHNAILDVWSKS